MAAGPWTATNALRTKILNRYISGGSALTFKCALFLSTSNIGAASTTYAAATNEVATANGYTVGGVPVAFTLVGTTSLAIQFTTNPQWVATGGNIVARFAGIYEVGADIVFYCLLDSTPADYTTTSGNLVQLDSDGVPNPVFQIA